MRRKLTITLLATLIMVSFWQLAVNTSAQSPYTLAQILVALQTKGNKPETATLAARNVYIAKRVQTFGVNFRLLPEYEKDLRAAGATSALIAVIRANGPSAPTPTPYSNTRSSAAFKDLWVDYGVQEGGLNGMRIHVKFTTYGMRNLDSYLAIYFMNGKNYLKDNNDSYNSSSDDVAVYRALRPIYETQDFNDFSVFMPYKELDLPDGNYTLTMDVKLIYKGGGLIQELTKKAFEYDQGAPVEPYVVNNVWIDYNVTEGGRKGMRIHVDFKVTGLKEVDSKLTIRVQRENDTYLTSRSSGFSNPNGELQLEFAMKPGYETTVYKDADVFLPYSEINLGSGLWKLKLDIDLNYEDGRLIKHLKHEYFQFERQ